MSLFAKRRPGATIPLRKLVNRKGRTHVQTYWVTPEEMAAHQAANSADTKTQHTNAQGEYTPERAALHQQIISRIVRSCPKPPEGEQPECVLLLGGAASGKSTVVNALNLGENSGTLNADDIKDLLPEYGEGAGRDLRHSNVLTAAANVHEESSDIGKVALNSLIKGGRNFVYDAVLGNPKKAQELVGKLKGAGYRVRLVGVSLDTDTALSRARLRALGNREEGGSKPGNGRYVPEEILAHGHAGSAETFDAIKDQVDEAILYDNNVDYGQEPIRVLDSHGIYHPELYSQFQGKAKPALKKGFNLLSPQFTDYLRSLLQRKKPDPSPLPAAPWEAGSGLGEVRKAWELRKALAAEAATEVNRLHYDYFETESEFLALEKAVADDLQKGGESASLAATAAERFAAYEAQHVANLFHAVKLQKAAVGQANTYGALFFESVCENLISHGVALKKGLVKALRVNSHLVPQKRIDKRGHTVTRWVQPGALAHFKNTLGIPREHMPQIESQHVPAFVDFMKKRGAKASEGEVAVKNLLPTQLEMNPDKVASLLNADNLDHLRKPVLTSTESDGGSRLLDGHHRYAGLLTDNPENTIKQVKFDMPMHKLLEHARAFPHTTYKAAKEAGPTAKA
jgi:predicted ABC-type ATPase